MGLQMGVGEMQHIGACARAFWVEGAARQREPQAGRKFLGLAEEFAEEKTVVEDADGTECEAWMLLEISE